MSSTDKYRNRLITLLKELFQLDKPELDFGLYKIMHAKSGQISRFLENDLLKEIQEAFGEAKESDTQALKTQAREQLVAALGETAIDETGKLAEAFAATPAGKHYVEAIQAAEAAKGTLNAEAEIYDHLYRFFERYYDNGDFMSRRYYARESDSRAAPYAVPYDGREVYLHWANKDQYYIKSSEYLSNYTFDLNEAIRQESERQQRGKGEGLDIEGALGDTPHKVHFRIVEASEGEHGNIKASSDLKRFFMIHDEPAIMENGELVIQFQYRPDPEKSGQDKKWQEKRLEQAEERIVKALENIDGTENFLKGLQLPAPTESQKKRSMLGKHLQKYAARNTMDYFIHKDLGGFLRRELDFYIKNEIMRLDDLENAEASKVEQYLEKIRVLRRIARQLIAFLAQVEDFQKKLWLKKKFVTESQYCITLDRIPESFYPEIAGNESQREEWVRLFAIHEIQGDLGTIGYSEPLTVEFLQANPFLIIDTALFSEEFKARLLNEIQQLDYECDGCLINSENFQAISALSEKYRNNVKCVFTDPPYNTKNDSFPYKDSYKHASWMSMMLDRVAASKDLLRKDGAFFHHIDENEHINASFLLTEVFGEKNRVVDIVWKNSSKNGESYVSMQHEYIIGAVKDTGSNKGDWKERKEGLEEIYRAFDGFRSKYGDDWEAIHEAALDFYNSFPDSDPIRNSKHYSWMDEKGVYFPDNISKPAKGYFYDIPHPITGEPCKKPAGGWRFIESTMDEKIRNNEIHFGKDHTTVPNNKTYLKNTEQQSLTSIKYKDGRVASNLLKDMFGKKDPFKNPKDVDLTRRLLKALEVDDQLVLDFFAGSGTTIHAVIEMLRSGTSVKYLGVEMGEHFDNVLLPRIKRAVYSPEWKDGKPLSSDGTSQFFKYLRLESYEDTLNNLALQQDSDRDAALENNPALHKEYFLNYFLDVETRGSQSLLSIADFYDPTMYAMRIKKPGSDEQILKKIDLIETFNWLIGLWVEHFSVPQSFSAEFSREKDSDLPDDQSTRLICTRLKHEADGNYWFRLVEGHTLRVPGDKSTQVSTLIIWRKLTDDPEKDNAALQKYLETIGVSTRERTYEVIYVNGSHALPNPVVEGEQTKVRLIEEAFHQAMWAEA